jgi:hypothetical protein
VDIIATVPYDLADGPPVVALLSDGILVLPVDQLRFDGTVRVFDREGNPWGETMLSPVPDGLAATALGAPGTLYVVTLSEIDNSQTVHAYQHNGTVWSETNVTVISDNNDASYTVSSEGLMLGSELVMAATPPIQDSARAEWLIRQGNTVVERTEPDGTKVTWRVIEQFENFSTPPIVHPFDNGVIYMGNASGEVANRYIGVLGADGTTAFYRPGPWMLAGVDESTALFTQVIDGQLQLGRIGFGARPTQIDWAESAVLGTPIGYYGPDTLQERINPVLGEPTADSGWFVVEAIAPGDEDCLAGQELRVLHWGDLTVAFKKGVTPDGLEGEQMWSWVVGDLRASGFSSFREPVAAPIGTPTGLHTEDGFGVGSSIDDLQGEGDVLLSDFVNADGSRGGYFTPATGTDVSSSRSFVIDADGTVIGFGATQAFC